MVGTKCHGMYYNCTEQFFLVRYDTAGTMLSFDTVNTFGNGCGNTSSVFGLTYLPNDNSLVISGTLKGGAAFSCDSLNTTVPQIFVAKLSLSTLSSVNKFESTDHLTVYPNPSNGILKIYSQDAAHLMLVRICDLLGDPIFIKRVSKSDNEIDLSTSPKGVYFLEILTGQNRVIKKIILE